MTELYSELKPTHGVGTLCKKYTVRSVHADPASCLPRPCKWLQEAGIMAGLRHPCVVSYMGACLDPPCLVMEVGGGVAERSTAAFV